MKHIILFSVSVLFVCLSCVPSDINSELSDIETYISVRPDSALHVLDSMDRGLLTSKSLKARHALLYVMASDKNFIDVTDDSISRLAVDYYRNHGKREYYARALYYHGVAYYKVMNRFSLWRILIQKAIELDLKYVTKIFLRKR